MRRMPLIQRGRKYSKTFDIMKECNVSRCGCKATYEVCLKLVAVPNRGSAESTPIVYLCKKHSKTIKWDDVVNDEGWAKICMNLVMMGYKKPEKALSSLIVRIIQKRDMSKYKMSEN